VSPEIGDGHVSGQDEGGWPGEQADAHQQSADQFDHALQPDQGRQLQMVEGGRMRKAKQLGRAMVQEAEAGNKA